MVHLHIGLKDSNSGSIDIDMEETADASSRRKSKSKSKRGIEPSPELPKRKRHKAREHSDSKDMALEIRETLLDLIKTSAQTEIKVFASSSTEALEETENANLSGQADFQTLSSYPEALWELVTMFDKLRRFPKLIAKLLRCFRDYIFNESDSQPNPTWNEVDTIELFLPHEFVQSLGPICASLPAGQMMDLFKTFYHNLHEECIKPICLSQGNNCVRHIHFLQIVMSLLREYLASVKIADYTVTAPTMEKVSEILLKICEECLKPLGETVIQSKETALLQSFLNLALIWGDLHGFLIYYKSDMYKQNISQAFNSNSDPSEVNMSFLHSYMASKSWEQLGDEIENNGDSICKMLWAKLMIQKLKYMTILGKPTCLIETIDEEALQAQLRTTTLYLLSHQDSCELSLNELYNLTSQCMDDAQIITLVRHLVRHGSEAEYEVLLNSSSCDARFETSLCIETLDYIFSRLNKLKLLPKWCRKTLTNEVLSSDKKLAMLSSATNKNATIFGDLLAIVNEFIENASQSESQEENPDFVSDEIIATKLEFLNNLFLEDYPTHLKTLTALSSIVLLLVAAAQHGETGHILNKITSILFQTASQAKGNETLFAVSWTGLYSWLCENATKLRPSCLRNVLLAILQNVYMSAKSISEFGIAAAGESFCIDSPMTPVHLITLEFLLKELPVSVQAKSKLTPQLQDHIRRSTHAVVKALKKSSSSSSKRQSQAATTDASLLANIFRACWLTQLAMPNLSSEAKTESESTNDHENSIIKLKKIWCKHVESAFEILEKATNQEGKSDDKSGFDDDTNVAKTFALIFLHTVCKSRNELGGRLQQTFVNQLWTVCMNATDEDWDNCERLAPTEDTRLMAKDLFEMANPEEFSALKDSLLKGVKNAADEETPEIKLKPLVHILNCLLDSTLKNSEQKDDRREILDGVLCSMVKLSLRWNGSNECLRNMVLPVLEFQTKLVKRRNAMSSAICSATCLSSITSVPLHDIIDTKLYREAFCCSAELLNAFTIHRLDVLTFRMPIYLQCFQFLIESVTSRASQDNKLADAEIICLKYCAHEMERTCQSMKLNQKEFSRVSPYFVATMMKQFEMFAVYPAVKNPLLSGCYKLLDLCDGHGIAQLNSMLTVGARETFKSVYELYNKFYRFKGKV